MTPQPLFEKYPFLERSGRLISDYTEAMVVSEEVNNNQTNIDVVVSLVKPVPPYEIAIIEDLIADETNAQMVNIRIVFSSAARSVEEAQPFAQNPPDRPTGTVAPAGTANPAPQATPAPQTNPSAHPKKPPRPTKTAPPANTIIMGRVTKNKPKPMREVTIDDGRVTIRGHVCADRSRLIERNNSWLLNFDLTDYTNTINVSRFLGDEKTQKTAKKIKKGMYLTVSGSLAISNYDKELTLNPQNIYISEYETREDTAEEKRVELHLHTKMSTTDGLIDVKELIKLADKWGHTAIAITDHGVVHSFPEAAKHAAAVNADRAKKGGKKLKVIYGMEGFFVCDDAQKKQRHHIILIAKNKTGLKNLYKLVTASHVEYFKKRPIINRSVLETHRDGLIIGSACEAGELYSAIIQGKEDETLLEIARYYDYLEIQPLCNNLFMILSENYAAKSEEDIRGYNRKIIELGKALNKPVVATCDAHFIEPCHEIFRRIILAGKGFETADDELPIYFRTTDEMLNEFSYLGEETAYEVVVTNTNKIADMCEDIPPLPPNKQFFPPKLKGSADELKNLISTAIPALYGENPPQIVTERMQAELTSILSSNYDVIYMTAQKLVEFLISEGSRVGSRGSIGSSFVAYLAGITEVNPLPAHYRCQGCKNSEFADTDSGYNCGADMPDKLCPHCGATYIKDGFNIPFETFLGFKGEKIPDIDLNISGEYQSKAQAYIYELFGSNHVFRAGTIGTIAEKNAYKMVKKYMEVTGKHVTKAEENRLAAGCVGVKQTTGQHPGGLVIIPQDKEVTDFCPVQYPSDDSEKGVITTHFDYHKMEDHLIKLDVLGHDNPTMLVMLEEMTGVNADDIKLDDADTLSIFSSPAKLGLPEDDEIVGKTGAIGIPEFGTPFARQMLNDTKPERFDTLVRLSGFSHGEKVWANNAKDLIFAKTATVAQTISSRDDIMLYLISKNMVAQDAFAISEKVRKGAGLTDSAEDSMRRLGVPGWYIESCKKIGYLFPRAHAVAYVMMAFRIAWFKVHRPIEYYSAHFYRRCKNGAFDASFMIDGIDRVKAKIREIKNLAETTKKDEELMATLESCYEFYLRGFEFANIDLYESDAERFLIVRGGERGGGGGGERGDGGVQDGDERGGGGKCGDDTGGDTGKLRPPFVAIGGLGAAAALALAESRKDRRFISIEEITACSGVNKTHIAELTRLGALNNLPNTNQMSLF